jgi:hypothetical protein
VEWGALPDEIAAVLEVAHPLVELPPFQAVANAGELFVFPLNFRNDGVSVGLELGSLLMMAVVAFDLSRGGEVQHTDR